MKNDEYKKASDLTKALLSVPHSEIKKQLEQEKVEKLKRKASKVKRNDH